MCSAASCPIAAGAAAVAKGYKYTHHTRHARIHTMPLLHAGAHGLTPGLHQHLRQQSCAQGCVLSSRTWAKGDAAGRSSSSPGNAEAHASKLPLPGGLPPPLPLPHARTCCAAAISGSALFLNLMVIPSESADAGRPHSSSASEDSPAHTQGHTGQRPCWKTTGIQLCMLSSQAVQQLWGLCCALACPFGLHNRCCATHAVPCWRLSLLRCAHGPPLHTCGCSQTEP